MRGCRDCPRQNEIIGAQHREIVATNERLNEAVNLLQELYDSALSVEDGIKVIHLTNAEHELLEDALDTFAKPLEAV